MALAISDITPRLANAEMGNPIGSSPWNDLTVKQVCEYASQNRWSFYGPGTLGVDANKTVAFTAPSSDYKLGDFRLYNHSASIPAPPTAFTHYWGPSGTTTNVPMVSFPQALNVLFVNASATYITYKAYLTTTDRTNETNLHDSFTEAWSGSTITQLTGHTRTQTTQIDSTHIGEFTSFLTTGTSDPDYIYMDVYLSDVSGNRLINLGASVAGCYFTLTLRKNAIPQINSSGNCVSRSGYTGTFTAINTSSTQCGENAVTQTLGSATWSFYLTAVGIQTGSWNIYPTSCTIVLYHYDGDGILRQAKTLGTTETLNSGTAKQFSSTTYGNLTNTWAYNDYGIVSVTAVNTWGTAVTC